MKGSFKTALIAATVSAFVAAGAAVATTQTFVLGTTNRVNAATKATNLQANGTTVNPVDAPLLTLENKSTTANATPLALNAGSGRPPMTVNSGARVTNLNAEKLDGIDSGSFVQGRGSLLTNRLVFDPTDTKTLMQFPGLGELQATCGASSSYIVWDNTAADTVDLWISPENLDGEFNPGLVVEVVVISFSSNVRLPVATLMLGVGNGANQRRVASINVAIHQSAQGATCDAEAQGTIWKS
jgi:hypothetical protein